MLHPELQNDELTAKPKAPTQKPFTIERRREPILSQGIVFDQGDPEHHAGLN
jgi:hypothetical protein